MSEQVLTMSSQPPPMDSPIPSAMQSFKFPVPASSPSTPNRRSASPEKHQRNSSQDVQLRSPEKPNPEQLKPNPHPYAIKTTSTALLSRSNSASSKHIKHHYIPSTPPSNKRHRTTSSASNIEIPRPLPIPPPSPSPSDSEGAGNPHTGPPPLHQPRRLKRSETTFSTPPPPIAAPLTLEELPPNPKQWTPSQLSIYLATALRISGGGPGELPAPIASDIAKFVRERKIGGRVFLRLSEEELEAYGMNKLWRTALLSASRTLRQNVLKGRIWGAPDDDSGIISPASPESQEFPSSNPSRLVQHQTGPKDEDETTPNNRKSVFIQRPVYSSAESNSSIEDLSHPLSPTPLNLPLLPTSISDGTGSTRFKSISKGSTRSKGGKNSRLLASSGFFDAPASGTGLPSESTPDSFFAHKKSPGRYKNGRVKGMAKGFERIASVDESSSDIEPSPSPQQDELNHVLASPTHSRMLSGENKSRIMKDMEVLKMKGRVKMERERRTSVSSSSEAGSPTKSRMIVDLPCESPTKMFADEEDAAGDYGATVVRANHTGPEMPTWDFEPEYRTMKRNDTGSSVSSTSSTSSRPLPMPPGPPPAILPPPNLSVKSPAPAISTLPTNTMSPIPTPPPSAGDPVDEAEMSVEQLLALQGAGDSVRRRKNGKDAHRVGVHAWENDEADEGSIGFVTAKRVPLPVPPHVLSPSLSSPLPPSPPIHQTSSPSWARASPLPQEMAQSKRVITPISSAHILPSRKITPMPAQVINPMRVTTELAPAEDGNGMGGIVHPKPVTVVEREITNSVGADTIVRMEEIVRREEEVEQERQKEREKEKEREFAVVRPLPTPPQDRSPVIAPLTALNPSQPKVRSPTPPRVKKETEEILVVQRANTQEQQELEDEEELQALIADVLKTKSQVEVMKKRLGEVEKNVEELKKEVDEAEAKYNFDTIRQTTPKKTPTPEPEEVKEIVPVSATEKAKKFLFSALGFSSATSSYTDPKSISDLPPYIALVSLGVCMVVVRVLLKKKGGR